MLRSMLGSSCYGSPTILVWKGLAKHSAWLWEHARTGYCQIPASASIGLPAASLSNDLASTEWPEHDTWRVPGLDSNWTRTHTILWLYHEHLPWVGCSVVSGENGLHVVSFCLLKELGPGKAIGKAIPKLLFLPIWPTICLYAHVGSDMFWTGILRPLYSYFLVMACSKRSELSVTSVGDLLGAQVYKHSISFTQPHLNPLLIVRGSSLHLERLCGTIR